MMVVEKLQIWLLNRWDIFTPGAIKSYYNHQNYQLSDELLSWIECNKDFRNSLKLRHPKRFRKIQFLITSHTPLTHQFHEDQIIGLWYLDAENYRKRKHPYFKQDFIVNKGGNNLQFISYAQKSFAVGKHVDSIDNFFNMYGQNKAYYHKPNSKWEHHYNDLSDLPDQRLINLAQKMILALK